MLSDLEKIKEDTFNAYELQRQKVLKMREDIELTSKWFGTVRCFWLSDTCNTSNTNKLDKLGVTYPSTEKIYGLANNIYRGFPRCADYNSHSAPGRRSDGDCGNQKNKLENLLNTLSSEETIQEKLKNESNNAITDYENEFKNQQIIDNQKIIDKSNELKTAVTQNTSQLSRNTKLAITGILIIITIFIIIKL